MLIIISIFSLFIVTAIIVTPLILFERRHKPDRVQAILLHLSLIVPLVLVTTMITGEQFWEQQPSEQFWQMWLERNGSAYLNFYIYQFTFRAGFHAIAGIVRPEKSKRKSPI